MVAYPDNDPQKARREALENGSGLSHHDIQIRLGRRVLTGTSTPPYGRQERQPRQTGNVRGYHDGELRFDEDPRNKRGPELTAAEQDASDAMLAKLRSGTGAVARKMAEIERRAVQVVPDNRDDRARVEVDRRRYILVAARKAGLI